MRHRATAETKGGTVKGSLTKEIGQSFFLMGLMAAVLSVYVGVGLLAVHVLG
jgi:hypothetical protein